jgi:hypothetical protein
LALILRPYLPGHSDYAKHLALMDDGSGKQGVFLPAAAADAAETAVLADILDKERFPLVGHPRGHGIFIGKGVFPAEDLGLARRTNHQIFLPLKHHESAVFHPQILHDDLENPAQPCTIIKTGDIDHPGNPGKTVKETIDRLQIPQSFLSSLHGSSFPLKNLSLTIRFSQKMQFALRNNAP